MNYKKFLAVGLLLGLTTLHANTTQTLQETTDEKEIFMCKYDFLADVVSGHKYAASSVTKSVFIDSKTFKTNKDGSKEGWVVFVATREDTEAYDNDEGYTKVYIKVSKDKRTWIPMTGVGYDCRGIANNNYNNSNTWIQIIPGSLLDEVANKL